MMMFFERNPNVSTLLKFTLIFAVVLRSHAQSFRPSSVEIVPDLVVVNPNSNLKFSCQNHQLNEGPLEVALSKNISPDQVQLSTAMINSSTVQIHLVINDYMGLFHLLCYARDRRNEGTRSDVIIKATPGVLQLAERCQVFDRQFIKCTIRASKIARAVLNDYPLKFEFQEINQFSEPMVYNPRFEFCRNESTEESLIFKWKPMVDGEFPNGLRMRMRVTGPYFNTSVYQFDMTPIFRITPKFNLRRLSSTSIEADLSSQTESFLCERQVQETSHPHPKDSWVIINHGRNRFAADNLRPNTVYRVCLRCRQFVTDPYGEEQCDEIRTGSRFAFIEDPNWRKPVLIFVLIPLLALVFIIAIVLCIVRRSKSRQYHEVHWRTSDDYNSYNKTRINLDDSARRDRSASVLTRVQTDTDSQSRKNSFNIDDAYSISDNPYVHLASLNEVIEMNYPKELTS